MKHLLLVFIGGGLGSITRYLVSRSISASWMNAFPLGTFIINITGCFLIGLFVALNERYAGFTTEWRIFLATGFCGGFTTFSAFSYENISLLAKQEVYYFALYTGASVVVGLLATFIGMSLIKNL